MTLQTILDDIAVRLPHTFQASQVVVWLNEGLNSTWHNNPSKKIVTIVVSANDKIITLPTDCIISKIIQLKLYGTDENEIEYKYSVDTANKFIANKYYDLFDGTIGIYPATTYARTAKLEYYYKPAAFDVSAPTAELTIGDDYANALKYYAMQIIAASGNNPDTEIANMYRDMYNEAMGQVNKQHNNKAIATPTKKKCNNWW